MDLSSSPVPSRSVRRARHARGYRTRSQILAAAVDIASAEGLEGLTIGRLAEELGMSKSGLFAHFGSKEDLQVAVVETAREIFTREVVRRAASSDPGLERLRALCFSWVSYLERNVFRGGCFFAAASAEFDGRPGAVRDLIASLAGSWFDALATEAREARSRFELRADTDETQLAFELHAYLQEANRRFQLLKERDSFERARRAIEGRLKAAATAFGRDTLETTTPSYS